MLGIELLRAGERAGHVMIGLARSELDVTDARGVGEVLAQIEPDGVLNCAAWTDVDGAESRPEFPPATHLSPGEDPFTERVKK